MPDHAVNPFDELAALVDDLNQQPATVRLYSMIGYAEQACADGAGRARPQGSSEMTKIGVEVAWS